MGGGFRLRVASVDLDQAARALPHGGGWESILCGVSWPTARQCQGLSPNSAFAAYVMPLLFTGRDKEESCTEDVPTVAMTVSKPPSPPSTNSS